MKEVRLIMLIRSGVGFLTSHESKAYQDFVDIEAEGTDDEPIACGAPLNGPAIPIPGLNRDGNMVSVIETTWTPEEITLRLSEADDYLPTLAIDITDQVENGTLSINAQMGSEPLGGMLQEIFDIEPMGEYDAEAQKEKQKKQRKKRKDKLAKRKGHGKKSDDEDECDCPACELRRGLMGKLGKDSDIDITEFPGGMGIGIPMDDIDSLDGIKDILSKLIEERGLGKDLKDKLDEAMSKGMAKKGDGKSKKYKRKTCKLNMDQLLDLIKERGGIDNLEDSELQRLDELSKDLN